MRWYPKTLKCQVFEDGQLIDLNRCSDSVLESLSDSIVNYWKTPVNSAVWFDIQIYEKHYWFKPPKSSIEVVAYVHDMNKLSGRKQVNVSQLYIDKTVGRKMPISPKDELMRKWSPNVEVAFVV
jgi:hypothetical protein